MKLDVEVLAPLPEEGVTHAVALVRVDAFEKR
jgi:hypothetical protein